LKCFKSLTEAGFLINVDKSAFTPAQSIEWRGIIWDSVNFSLQIPDRRVQDLIESVILILSEFPLITARYLARVTGKIISMSPVIGNISRLMTRYCYMITETRSAWDSLLEIIHSDQVKAELVFWQENIVKLNRKYLAGYSCSSVVKLIPKPSSKYNTIFTALDLQYLTMTLKHFVNKKGEESNPNGKTVKQ
jgi:hypothetical protein